MRASEHLRLTANSENPQPNATMRGVIDRFMEEILRPSLDVPVGGIQDQSARMGFACASGYRNSLEQYILPNWEKYEVRAFEKPEIRTSLENWFRSLLRSAKNPDGLAPKTLHHLYTAMRQVFKFAVKWGYLSLNPLAEGRVELPRAHPCGVRGCRGAGKGLDPWAGPPPGRC